MNSFSNYGAHHVGEHLLRVDAGGLNSAGPGDTSMVKIGESRMSRIEDDDQVTPIKKQEGDSDSS